MGAQILSPSNTRVEMSASFWFELMTPTHGVDAQKYHGRYAAKHLDSIRKASKLTKYMFLNCYVLSKNKIITQRFAFVYYLIMGKYDFTILGSFHGQSAERLGRNAECTTVEMKHNPKTTLSLKNSSYT